MRLRNRSGEAQAEVELGLNPGLRVNGASAAGETVSSQRIGELIRLGPLPAAVAAGEEIEFELLYAGVPILLREDYQLASNVTGERPVSFQQAYVSFADGHALQWMRDSDWLAWPRTPGPHVARESHSLQIALNNSDGPFLSSGAISEQTGDEIVYVWENPPQFLVAGGAYRHSSSAEGNAWVGKLSTEQTTATARKLLRLRRAMGDWLEASPLPAYQVVELPYVQGIAIGGLFLGFPNEIESRFYPFSTSVTTSDSSSGTPPAVKTVHTPAAASELNLAVEVGRAWLSDQIRWPKNQLNIAGILRSYVVTCELPDDTGNQECTRESLGGINSQAPLGRWIEEPESPVGSDASSAGICGCHCARASTISGRGSSIHWERTFQVGKRGRSLLRGPSRHQLPNSAAHFAGKSPCRHFGQTPLLPACPFRRCSQRVQVPIRARRLGRSDSCLGASTSPGRRPSY